MAPVSLARTGPIAPKNRRLPQARQLCRTRANTVAALPRSLGSFNIGSSKVIQDHTKDLKITDDVFSIRLGLRDQENGVLTLEGGNGHMDWTYANLKEDDHAQNFVDNLFGGRDYTKSSLVDSNLGVEQWQGTIQYPNNKEDAQQLKEMLHQARANAVLDKTAPMEEGEQHLRELQKALASVKVSEEDRFADSVLSELEINIPKLITDGIIENHAEGFDSTAFQVQVDERTGFNVKFSRQEIGNAILGQGYRSGTMTAADLRILGEMCEIQIREMEDKRQPNPRMDKDLRALDHAIQILEELS